MRLAVLQHDSDPGDWQANLVRLEESVQVAAEHRVDVLVSPELYITGCDGPALAKAQSPAGLQRLHRAVQSLATGSGVALAYSLPEHHEGMLRIASYFVDAHGQVLSRYARVHLADNAEGEIFAGGHHPPRPFEYLHTTMALSSGYDVQFPEHARAAARAGAKVLLVPAACGPGAEALALKLLPARAMENGIYLLWANHSAAQGAQPMSGASTIVGPDGQNIQLAGQSPQVLVAALDRQHQQAVRRAAPYLARLRPEVYG